MNLVQEKVNSTKDGITDIELVEVAESEAGQTETETAPAVSIVRVELLQLTISAGK